MVRRITYSTPMVSALAHAHAMVRLAFYMKKRSYRIVTRRALRTMREALASMETLDTEQCEECKAFIPDTEADLFNRQHADWCSLHPDNGEDKQ